MAILVWRFEGESETNTVMSKPPYSPAPAAQVPITQPKSVADPTEVQEQAYHRYRRGQAERYAGTGVTIKIGIGKTVLWQKFQIPPAVGFATIGGI